MIDITSKTGKVRFWRSYIRTLNHNTKYLTSKVKEILLKQYSKFLNLLKHGVKDFSVLNNWNTDLRVVFYNMGKNVFGSKWKELESIRAKSKGYQNYFIKDAFGAFWRAAEFFLSNYSARKVKEITDTTRKYMARRIKLGLVNGLSDMEIADTMLSDMDDMTKSRALRIALTETHSLMETANLESVRSWDMQLNKEWISAMDDRVRPAHEEANGQTVELDDMFLVDGEELDSPGDPNGSPGNIINCRCTTLFHSASGR